MENGFPSSLGGFLRKGIKLTLAGLFLSASSNALAAKVDPKLRELGVSGSSTTRIIALMDHPELKAPPKYQRERVLKYLQVKTKTAWSKVENGLSYHSNVDRHIRNVEVRWINNSFSADVDRRGLRILSRLAGVRKIYAVGEIKYNKPVASSDSSMDFTENKLPYDFPETGMDKLIAEAPEIDGKGVVLGSIDTGVDAEHRLLQGKIVGFYDGRKKRKSDKPYDFHSHGTHTIGTMIGGDRIENHLGMAPGAKVIAAAALLNYDTMLKAMQWMLDPDENPSTDDAPKAINNSWHSTPAPDQELFYQAIAAWEAAGIMPVFSAGNSGPRDRSITRPKEYPGTFSVGATRSDGKIARFSSRGPAIYKGEEVLKPEISAPGKGINSTTPRGRMGRKSGTSMAAPHVTGAIALMLQVNPTLTPSQMRHILIHTSMARDLDGNPIETRTWNKAYGYGKLNAYEAVKAAKSLAQTTGGPRLNLGFSPTEIDPFQVSAFKPQSVEESVREAMEFPKDWDTNWLSSTDLF